MQTREWESASAFLPGVSQVAVYGTQSAVRIKADPSAIATHNITLEDLTNAVKNGTSYTGAGQFDGPHHSFLLQPQGQLSTADQYQQLIVGQSNGTPIDLKDVATAKDDVILVIPRAFRDSRPNL
jgi:hydrophobic/amphiphilic exporter-1 (mainly G- bacteria), HAE1 family